MPAEESQTRKCDQINVAMHFFQEEHKPSKRLIRLEVLTKALKGEELAQRLISCLAVH